uniref:Neurotransmitter-gated ion-channel ligand-binding domain-containing protein n=1 Tax=Romanomermis culicivorax TaxID=13658 RepID=A0A915JWM2_ROMCU
MSSSFTADIYYSQIWIDPRLSYKGLTNQTHLSLDESVVKSLWTPSVAISNSKVTALHSSPTPNTLLIIYDSVALCATVNLRKNAIAYPACLLFA